jgi:hypothetical protein
LFFFFFKQKTAYEINSSYWSSSVFSSDLVVPLVRVQHIDVTRGPLEKAFGVATLVVHTAGTHNSIVMLPGLAPQRAAEIRDIIREHVRTDFA